MRCAVKGCQVEQDSPIPFVGDFCQPCYDFITQGIQNHSTAYRNSGIPSLRAIAVYFKSVFGFYTNLPWYHEPEESPTDYYARIRQPMELVEK